MQRRQARIHLLTRRTAITEELGAASAAQLGNPTPRQGGSPDQSGGHGFFFPGAADEDWGRDAPITGALSNEAQRGPLSAPADAPHAATEAVGEPTEERGWQGRLFWPYMYLL